MQQDEGAKLGHAEDKVYLKMISFENPKCYMHMPGIFDVCMQGYFAQ